MKKLQLFFFFLLFIGTVARAQTDCNSLAISSASSSISITGATAPVVLVQAFDASWTSVYNQNFTNAPGTVAIPNLTPGTYFVKVDFLTASWAPICKKESFVTVNSGTSGTTGGALPVVSSTNISVAENAGNANVIVNLSASSTSPVTVQYSTSSSSALAGVDFSERSGQITFPSGVTQQTISIPLTDDNLSETSETFKVDFSAPNGATLADNSMTVTITDNDAATGGGTSGTGTTNTGAPDCNTITIAASGSNIAVGGLNAPITLVQAFNSAWVQVFNQTFTTPPGSVTIPNLVNGTYFVKVDFLNASWAPICKKEMFVTTPGTTTGGGGGTTTPTLPIVAVSNVTVGENGGNAVVGLTLSAASTTPVTVQYSTSPVSAANATDYTAVNGTVTFPAGATQRSITVPIVDDNVVEQTETFKVDFSNAVGATLSDNSVTVTITDNDTSAPPSGTPDCNTIVFSGNSGAISVSGLNAPIVLVQAYNSAWAQVFNQTYTNQPGSISIPNLTNGTYYVKIDFLNAQWNAICYKESFVPVTSTSTTVAPVATNDAANTPFNTAVVISPLTNDNLNGGTLQSVALVGNPTNGSVTQSGTNFQYTPIAGFSGTDQFTYRIQASNGQSNNATVTVTVASNQVARKKFRTFDGTENNLANATYGKTETALARELPAEYGSSDPKNALGGVGRPNPRAVSNLVCFDPVDIFNTQGISALTYMWGQFIDHDMMRTAKGTESAPIPLPANEPLFVNPISFKRSAVLPGTGVANNREQFNETTAWLDGSMVYGYEAPTISWLRTFTNGKLKTSTGNNLPYNTTTGQLDAPIDPESPPMENDRGKTVKVFVAGDERASEHPGLISLHTVFLREHNRICDRLISQGMTNDEEIYQTARKEVGALIQVITYQHFLPILGIPLPAYSGYNPAVSPNMLNTFATAGYRFGHSTVVSDVPTFDNDCVPNAPGLLLLSEVFFNTSLIQQYGFERFLKGLTAEVMYEVDQRINEQLRNFLVVGPTTVGLDLASINLQRGRDHGLPSYNKLRQFYTGTVANTFADISPVDSIAQFMQQLYGNVNNVDPWIGMLCERHLPGKNFGPTMEAMMSAQFQKVRDADFYYYANDPYLSNKAALEATTLKDIIVRNTSLTNLPNNVFIADPCPNACGVAAFTPNVGPAAGSNIIVPAACGSTTAVATWIPPTATVTGVTAPAALTGLLCPAPVITSNKLPGATFPVGVTPVTYSADYNGVIITRSFNVTVLDPSAKKLLFLCNNLSLNTSDNLIKSKLEALGYLVECKLDAGSGVQYLNGHTCVVVSTTCTNSHLGWLKSLVLPVISLKASLLIDLAMASTHGTNNYWSWDAYHCSMGSYGLWSWLFGGQTGSQKLFNFSFGSQHSISYGRPNLANADFHTFVPYSSQDCRTFGYRKGKAMSNGYVAPHRRVAVCYGDNKAQFLNNEGWTHLINAVKWAHECDINNPLVGNIQSQSLVFDATKKAHTAQLKWLNNTGEINDYFIIERSANGVDFTPIYKMEGEGERNQMLQFNYVDEQPLVGDNFYRITVVYKDGSKESSNHDVVNFKSFDAVLVYPNPAATDFVNIDLSVYEGEPVKVEISNTLGSIMYENKIESAQFEPVAVDISLLSAGNYIVKVQADGKRQEIKPLVIVRM